MSIVVDETTARTVVRALQEARTRCISPVVALDRAGILLTDDLANKIRRDVLTNVAEAIRTTRVKTLMEGRLIPKEPTPAVVIKAIADQIELLAAAAEKGDFR